jgi:hypothetical protein
MRILEIEVENERLRRENDALRNRLRFYENPNTPPSQPTLKRKRDERVQGDEKPKEKRSGGIEALPEKGWNLTK